jgi:hypothetical protein
MREFKIHRVVTTNDSVGFLNFMNEVEKRINSDDEILRRSEKANLDFAEKVAEILQNDENKRFMGSMIATLQSKIHRFSYIKNLEYNGKTYTAEIDELERKFWLVED